MAHYIKALAQVTFFEGSMSLSIDDRVRLTDSQFGLQEIQDAITEGSVVEISAQDAIKFRGAFPVTNTDRQLTKNENISVDTTLGMVHIRLYPNPRKGYAHYILPAELTWEDFAVRIDVTNPTHPVMSQADWYDLDISVGVYLLYVDESIGWRAIPS